MKHVKVAVTGAAGQIGYSLLFRLASGQVFGADTTIDLHLLEIEPSLPALAGLVMELNDCAFPLLRKIVATSDAKKAFDGVNWCLLVGAFPRKQGMERADLLGMNGKIFTAQGRAINDNAADDVRVFVVGNPCNTNCLIAMNNAHDVPNDRFFAMTMLDQNRAQSQLAIKAGVEVTAVKKIAVWGNHSATQFPDFYHATIGGKAVLDVIKDEHWLQNEFIKTIQQRGATVIKARGASSAASAAQGVITGVQALINETSADDFYSMCRVSHGEYDIDEGLIFSFASQTKQGKSTIVKGIEFNDFSQQRLQITLDELRSERDMVQELGLI